MCCSKWFALLGFWLATFAFFTGCDCHDDDDDESSGDDDDSPGDDDQSPADDDNDDETPDDDDNNDDQTPDDDDNDDETPDDDDDDDDNDDNDDDDTVLTDCLRINPVSALLKVNGVQQYRLSSCSGAEIEGTPVWTAEAVDAGSAGAIDAGGLYTAPNAVPDPPFVRLTCQAEVAGESYTDETVVELTDQADPPMTRDQSKEILIAEYINNSAKVADPETVTAVGVFNLLAPGDTVNPAVGENGASPVMIEITSPTWFFMVDREPGAMFAHSVSYVFIDALTGAVTSQDEQWFPVVNGTPWFSSPFWSFYGDAAVYEGTDANRDLMDAIEAEAAALLSAAADAEGLGGSVDSIFPFWTEGSCPCLNPKRYALIIDAMDQDETINAEKTSYSLIFAKIMFTDYFAFDEVTYMSTAFLDQKWAIPTQANVKKELETIVAEVRPCDVFVLYFIGHGSENQLELYAPGDGWMICSGSDTPSLQNLFALIQARHKYLIMEACFSGTHIANMETWEQQYGDLLNLEIVSSADTDSKSTAPVFSLNFYDRLLFGMFTDDDFYDWYDAYNSSLAYSLMLERLVGRDGALYGIFNAGDTDLDGLPDRLEEIYGTDPEVADSNGDGTCDADEIRPVIVSVLNRRNTNPLATLQILHGTAPYYLTFLPLPPIPAETLTRMPDGLQGKEYHQLVQLEPQILRQHGNIEAATISAGTLPPGLAPAVEAVDQVAITGAPTQAGDFTFTVRLTDERGASGEKELLLRIRPALANTPGGTIQYSMTNLTNVRDNDLSLGEALLLAKGELYYADLQPYIDEEHPGEQRFVTGSVGANLMDQVRHAAGVTLVDTGAVVITGADGAADGDSIGINGLNLSVTIDQAQHLDVGMTTLINPTGPALHLTANASWNFIDSVYVEDGTAIGVKIEGAHNQIGYISSDSATAGVWLTGESCQDNRFDSVASFGGEDGFLIDNGASGNVINDLIVYNGTIGIRLNEAGPGNRLVSFVVNDSETTGIAVIDTPDLYLWGSIFDSGWIGLSLSGAGTSGVQIDNLFVVNSGSDGILLADGAGGNFFNNSDSVGNAGHGINLDGSSDNWFIGRIIARSNQLDGMIFQNGAADNVVESSWDGTLYQGFDYNEGDAGLVFTGENTTNNAVVSGGFFWRNAQSGILFTDGAHDNQVFGEGAYDFEVTENDIGIRFTGAGTRNNTVAGALVGDGTQLGLQTNLHGVEFLDGAFDNRFSGGWLIGNDDVAVLFDGAQTSGNVVSESEIGDCEYFAATNGVIFANGANGNKLMYNLIEGTVDAKVRFETGASRNAMMGNTLQRGAFSASHHGVVIEGATDNLIGDPSLSYGGNVIVENTVCGVQLDNASGNYVSGNWIGDAGSDRQPIGIEIVDGSGNTIGGYNPFPTIAGSTEIGAGNVLVGHPDAGIVITGAAAKENQVLGNVIGLTWPERAAGNQKVGIRLANGARDNLIGRHEQTYPQSASPWDNLIGRNTEAGVVFDGAATMTNRVYGNCIYLNGDESAAQQVMLTNDAHGNVPAPIVTVDPDNKVMTNNQRGIFYQMYYWPPVDDSFVCPVLVYAGYPTQYYKFDMMTLPEGLWALMPENWADGKMTADQSPFAMGSSPLATPADLYGTY